MKPRFSKRRQKKFEKKFIKYDGEFKMGNAEWRYHFHLQVEYFLTLTGVTKNG